MDGELEGMDDIFNDYKRKLEAANKQSSEMLTINEANFKKFQASARKRRILKKKRTAEVEEKVRDVGFKLSQLLGKPFVENTETYQFYVTKFYVEHFKNHKETYVMRSLKIRRNIEKKGGAE